MSLRINSNIAAMNAYRNLSVTDSQMSKSLEKLSSGFRINRAADDAAGLAISEGMRSQIGGLKQAVRNTQDGINVVQTADGALNESTAILQRMRDLSVQASNDGGLNTDAKNDIQTEMGQLKSELDRIAGTTEFNGSKLLDGNFNGTFQVGAKAGQVITVGIGSPGKGMDALGLGVAGVNVTGVAADAATAENHVAADGTATGFASVEVKAATGSSFGATTGNTKLNGTVTFGGKSLDLSTVQIADSSATTGWQAGANQAAIQSALDTTFGKDSSGNSLVTVGPGSTDTAALKFQAKKAAASTSVTDIAAADVTFTAESGAAGAITAIDKAITSVSTTRANLGAYQNRFEHTVNNLNVAVENLSASESSIRDTDMAQEMTNFTKNQILQQAGTAMLAQANQAPQSVLKLLG